MQKDCVKSPRRYRHYIVPTHDEIRALLPSGIELIEML
jgi:hypothetical protein